MIHIRAHERFFLRLMTFTTAEHLSNCCLSLLSFLAVFCCASICKVFARQKSSHCNSFRPQALSAIGCRAWFWTLCPLFVAQQTMLSVINYGTKPLKLTTPHGLAPEGREFWELFAANRKNLYWHRYSPRRHAGAGFLWEGERVSRDDWRGDAHRRCDTEVMLFLWLLVASLLSDDKPQRVLLTSD